MCECVCACVCVCRDQRKSIGDDSFPFLCGSQDPAEIVQFGDYLTGLSAHFLYAVLVLKLTIIHMSQV